MSRATQTLSIIIVTLNEAKHLGRLKASIERLEPVSDTQVETVLVDGGSTDGSLEAAREAGFQRVVSLPGANIPVCRNRGVREAGGTWLAFIDGDCELAPDWLREATSLLRTGARRIIGWPVAPPMPHSWVEEAWYTHWTHKNLHTESMDGTPVVRREAFRLITTRNMAFHRGCFDAVAGFDENLPTGEDTDFVFRAYMKGIEVLAVPSLHVIHHGEPKTLGAFYRQQLWHANRNSYQRIAAHKGLRAGGRAPAFTIVCLVSLLLSTLGLLLFVGTGRPPWLVFVAAWPFSIAAPAALMAIRAGRPTQFPALALLYAAYGLARSLDMVGLYRQKPSWKRGS